MRAQASAAGSHAAPKSSGGASSHRSAAPPKGIGLAAAPIGSTNFVEQAPFGSVLPPGFVPPKRGERCASRCGVLSPGATAWLPCRSGAVRFRKRPPAPKRRWLLRGSAAVPRAPKRYWGGCGASPSDVPLAPKRGWIDRRRRVSRTLGPEGLREPPRCRSIAGPTQRIVFPGGPKTFGIPCGAEASRGRYAPRPTEMGRALKPPKRSWVASSVARGRSAAEGEAPKHWTLSLPSRAEARSGERGDTPRLPTASRGGSEGAFPRRGTRQGDGSVRGKDGTTILKGCGHVKEQSEDCLSVRTAELRTGWSD